MKTCMFYLRRAAPSVIALCVTITGLLRPCFGAGVFVDGVADAAKSVQLTSTDYVSVLSWTNTFTVAGKLLAVADARVTTGTTPGVDNKPFELWVGFNTNGVEVAETQRSHDVSTNGLGYGVSSLAFADLIDVAPGEVIIDFVARMFHEYQQGYFCAPSMSLIFVPNENTAVTAFVLRAENTLVSDCADWQRLIGTNVQLEAGEYLVIASCSARPAAPGFNSLCMVRPTVNGPPGPELDIELPSNHEDGVDKCFAAVRGGYVGDPAVTNIELQTYTYVSASTTEFTHAAFIVLYQPNTALPEIDMDYRPGGHWPWSPDTNMLQALTVEFNQDSAVLQFCTLNLSTTDNTSRCEAALVLNDSINGFPVRQEELGSSFGLAQSYPGNLTLYHGTLTGSNDFTTYFGHVSGTPENDLDADNWYHTVVWVPIPEPSSLILYVIVGISVRKILRQCK